MPQTVPNANSIREPRRRHKVRLTEAQATLRSSQRLGERILREEEAGTAAFMRACRRAAKQLHAL
jgi:hypothetical protein